MCDATVPNVCRLQRPAAEARRPGTVRAQPVRTQRCRHSRSGHSRSRHSRSGHSPSGHGRSEHGRSRLAVRAVRPAGAAQREALLAHVVVACRATGPNRAARRPTSSSITHTRDDIRRRGCFTGERVAIRARTTSVARASPRRASRDRAVALAATLCARGSRRWSGFGRAVWIRPGSSTTYRLAGTPARREAAPTSGASAPARSRARRLDRLRCSTRTRLTPAA